MNAFGEVLFSFVLSVVLQLHFIFRHKSPVTGIFEVNAFLYCNTISVTVTLTVDETIRFMEFSPILSVAITYKQ